MMLRIGVAAAVVAALVVLFFVVRPRGDDGGATPTVAPIATTTRTATTSAVMTTQPPRPGRVRVRITVRDGRPVVDGLVRIDAKRGQHVSLRIAADDADHVHVHGYDLFADVRPGQPAVLDFNARLTGRFDIELEDTHRLIAQLRVTE